MPYATSPCELILLPSLPVSPGPNGNRRLTEKYLAGAEMFQRFWPGPVTSLFTSTDRPGTDLDLIDVEDQLSKPLWPRDAQDRTHRLELRSEDPAEIGHRIQDAAMVLAFLSPFELDTAALGHRLGVPMVMTSEYSIRTEFQIIDAERLDRLRNVRRKMWTIGAEVKRLRMLRLLAGVQCSGTPTFDIYRRFNGNPLLFFDNRVTAEGVIDDAALRRKLEMTVGGQAPLRLVFGGRFIPMKGVLDLPKMASALRSKNVRFTLDIYGDGPLADQLQEDIERRGLSDAVRLGGVLDFRQEWIPTLREQADVFVCPHPQGDPSSTYPEVMSCGVPIAGYGNEALRGIIQRSRGGWVVKSGDPEALAQQVARIAGQREEIANAALRARDFAREHVFERTFERRARHLINASRLPFGTRLSTVGADEVGGHGAGRTPERPRRQAGGDGHVQRVHSVSHRNP